MGIRPPGFEMLAFASLDQLDVWQSLICVVVLHLLSRGKNFHSNKHSKNFTQDGLVSLRKLERLLAATNQLGLLREFMHM